MPKEPLSARKVAQFVDDVVKEEKNYHRGEYWYETDVKTLMWKAIVLWDQADRDKYTAAADVTT